LPCVLQAISPMVNLPHHKLILFYFNDRL